MTQPAGEKIFVIDQSRCIGCQSCVQARGECGTHRGHSMIHLDFVDRGASTQTVPMVCMHCEDPTCAEACPADAIKRVGAAALSLGLTSGAMVWFKVPHPPAGATTLIVSLGILRQPWQLAVLMLAVALLVVQGFVINRLAGIDYPWWAPRPAPAPGKAPERKKA